VYGTAEHLGRTNIALWVVETLSAWKRIQVVTDQFRSPTYVDDLANGVERVVRFGKTGVFHVSGREIMSVYDFARRVAGVFDLDTLLIEPTDGEAFQQPAARPPSTGFIILKAETELGYKPRTVESALIDLRQRIGSSIPTDQ
jgi:dTDP-4-dehydrorhamnose reductase